MPIQSPAVVGPDDGYQGLCLSHVFRLLTHCHSAAVGSPSILQWTTKLFLMIFCRMSPTLTSGCGRSLCIADGQTCAERWAQSDDVHLL